MNKKNTCIPQFDSSLPRIETQLNNLVRTLESWTLDSTSKRGRKQPQECREEEQEGISSPVAFIIDLELPHIIIYLVLQFVAIDCRSILLATPYHLQNRACATEEAWAPGSFSCSSLPLKIPGEKGI